MAVGEGKGVLVTKGSIPIQNFIANSNMKKKVHVLMKKR